MAFITSTPLLLQTSCRNEIKYHRRRQFSMSQYQPTLSITRRSLLATFITTATTAIAISSSANAEDQQVELKTVTVGSGPSPVIGDLVGIRFKGSYNGVVFDNLFESTDPYFYRVGTGSVLLGIDETVLEMKVGQVVEAIIPAEKAFGLKGRRASPGKPSIAPNATVFYTIELTTIPGKDIELLENLSESEIGSSL